MAALKNVRKGGRAPARRRKAVVLLAVPVLDKAARLDREADHELALGHHVRAERLAERAAMLRGWSA